MTDISLIIPAYNCASTIEDCIKSVNAGAVQPDEIIIVNDQSTDNTLEIIKEIQKRQDNIRVLSTTKNSGPATARNVGGNNAKSQYLFFIDSDTIVDSETLEKYSDYCGRFDAIVGIYKETPINNTPWAWYKTIFYFYLLSKHPLICYDQFSASCAGIKRSVFLALGGYDEWFKPGCDLENEEFGHRIVDNGYTMVLLPEMQVAHKFPNFRRMVTTFFSRTALWVEMFCVRPKFSTSAGTPGMGLANISVTVSLFAALLGAIHYFFFLFAAFLIIPFLKQYIPFYVYCFNRYPRKTLTIIPLSIMFANVMTLGAAWGFARVIIGKSSIYKKFKFAYDFKNKNLIKSKAA